MNQHSIFNDILRERAAQDAQWGGASHDDSHERFEWWHWINKQNTYAKRVSYSPREFEARMVKVAALAVAAIESSLRCNPPDKPSAEQATAGRKHSYPTRDPKLCGDILCWCHQEQAPAGQPVRLLAAIEKLGMRGADGKTLFEGSPTRDEDCYRAWVELNDAVAEAKTWARPFSRVEQIFGERASTPNAEWWDQNSVECGCCHVKLVARGAGFFVNGKMVINTGLSREEGEEEALCGYCAGEELHRLADQSDELRSQIRKLKDATYIDLSTRAQQEKVRADDLTAQLSTAREIRITHLRCVEAILDQMDQIDAIDDEEQLADHVTKLAGLALSKLRERREIARELAAALDYECVGEYGSPVGSPKSLAALVKARDAGLLSSNV